MLKIKPLLISVCISAILTSPFLYGQQSDRNKLPEIGDAGLSTLSIEKERQIGGIMMRQVRSSQPLINDPVLTEYINHLGNSLVKNARDVNYRFTFFIINDPELNAFAFFGGHIGIHTGLITTASTESELASVVAHEISHVTQRHLARRIEAQNQMQPLSMAGIVSGVLLALINPTIGMAALTTSLAATQQANINYTRGNEKEADRVGIELLSQSGYNPQGTADFFSKMSAKYRYQSKPPAMLLTHPLSEARITDARLRAHSLPRVTLPPSLSFELASARIQARYQGSIKSNINYFETQLKKKTYSLKEAAEYGLALSYFENKNYQASANLLEPLYQNDKNNLFYIDVLCDLYLETDQKERAVTLMASQYKLMPNNRVVTLNYANALHKNGQNLAAEQLLQDFLFVQRGNFIAYDLLTSIYKDLKSYAKMHMAKAEVIALLGGFEEAIDELQTAYTFADDQPIIKKRIRARILQLQAQYDKMKRL